MRSIAKGVCALVIITAGAPAGLFAQSLGEALNNTNLVWTTSPNSGSTRPWVSTGSVTYDGVSSAVSGNQFLDGTSSWLETTLVGPGVLSYWCRVSSEDPQVITLPDEEIIEPTDYLKLEINDVEIQQVAGPCGSWTFRTFEIPAGTNIVRWTYVKDADETDTCGIDQARLDQVRYQPNAAPLNQALGTCALDWTSGATTNLTAWVGQTNVSNDGIAAASADAAPNEESWLQVTVAGVSNVSFLWRVSSRTNADYLEFYTNGYVHNPLSPPANYATRISGEVATWRSNYFKLSATATNTLTWRYVRNNQTAVNQSRGWLDQVKFNPTMSPTPFSLTAPALLQNGQFQLTVAGLSNCPCRVEYSTNLVNWSTVTELFMADSSATVLDPGATNSQSRFYRGNVQ